MTLLRASALCGGYAGADVVRDVDLSVAEGECVAVLGPNGAGKSTMLRLLAGILPVSAGQVELHGKPLSAWRRRNVAREVGFVPQIVNFAFPVTVAEVVEQGRAPHLGPWRPFSPADHAAIAGALARVGLSDRSAAAVQHLSGGERQLVLLARALATEPRLLLLDEPIAALDVRHQLEFAAILDDLISEGVGAVLVAHDWNFARRLAHRVVVLDHGRARVVGPPGEVLQPELFREVFGVDVELVPQPHSAPLIVARGPVRSRAGRTNEGGEKPTR